MAIINLYLNLDAAVCFFERCLERDINTKEIVESLEQSASDESEQTPKSTSKEKKIDYL